MKMNKVLPVVALLVSVHAFAWRPTLPNVKIPDFVKNACGYVTGKISTGASFCLNKVPTMPSVQEKAVAAIKAGQNLCSSGLNHVQNARPTKFIANHPKTAVAATGALAAYVAFAIFGKNFQAAAVNQGVELVDLNSSSNADDATEQK